MVKITKRLCIVLAMAVLVISFSIPFMLFSSKVYADSTTYTVGQTGPAGGIIFYKVSDGSGGWSYLEAAPSDIPGGVMKWSDTIGLAGTGTAIGTGQENTNRILTQNPAAPAAKACDDLVIGIYSDWFLPSEAELNLVYINLKAATPSLGGLGVGQYWSSSETSANHASHQAFFLGIGGGWIGASDKFYVGFNVRAIRAFSVPSGASPSKPLTPQEQVMLNLSIAQQADLYGRTNTGFIKMLYDNILGRVPDDEGLNNWATDLNNQMSPKDVVYYFIFSDELKPKIALMGPEEFITFLYENVFNREPDSDGYNNWVSLMKSGMSKEDVLLLFLNGNEFKNICTIFGLMQ